MAVNTTTRYFVDVVEDNTRRVIDGDTVEVLLDRGWQEKKLTSARLYGTDAPENHKTRDGGELEKKAGALVGEVTTRWLLERHVAGKQLYHVSMNRPKFFGRTIARLVYGWPAFDGTDDDLSDYLLFKQLVRPYKGEKKEPWPHEELEAIIARAEAILA